MSVSAAQVKELRERTGVGMLACKKAIQEANGDMNEAIALLRKRGEAKAAAKGERSTGEGAIAIEGRAIVKISCETDFVARNEDFLLFLTAVAAKANKEGKEAAETFFAEQKTDQMQKIGENLVLSDLQIIEGGDTVAGYVHTNKKVATLTALNGGTEELAKDASMHATAMDPLVANPEEISDELMDKEREIARQELIEAGKPEKIIDNILKGKMAKFASERALTSQSFVKNPDVTVAEHLGDAKVVTFIRMNV
jgi:elongation factor Ts